MPSASPAPVWIDEMPWGQPVDDPPPIIEPVEPAALAESGNTAEPVTEAPVERPNARPTRRLFLAPSARDLAAPPSLSEAASPPTIRVRNRPAPAEIPETAAPTAKYAATPWWRELPAAAPEPSSSAPEPLFPPDPPQVAFDPSPPARGSRVAVAVALERWRSVGRVSRDWRLRQKRPIVACIAAVVVVVVAAAGIGPLKRYFSATPVPPSVAQTQKLPAVPDDPAARVPFYLDRAKGGDAESQLELAILYARGEGVTQDYQQAATWFRAAAVQGVARAQYDLGVLYERGRGVPVDYAQAFAWYSRAAEGNFALAQYNLAVAYARGQGTRRDFVAAAEWYHRAATQGVVSAMVNLALLYERGEGVNASVIDAYAWYRAAASRGNQPSAKRAAELLDVLAASDRPKAEARAATVLSLIPAAAAGEVPTAPAGPPPILKSGIDIDAADGSAKPSKAAH